MADVDAISFSMAKLSRGIAGIDTIVAAHAIVLAAVANSLVKGIIVLINGVPLSNARSSPDFF